MSRYLGKLLCLDYFSRKEILRISCKVKYVCSSHKLAFVLATGRKSFAFKIDYDLCLASSKLSPSKNKFFHAFSVGYSTPILLHDVRIIRDYELSFLSSDGNPSSLVLDSKLDSYTEYDLLSIISFLFHFDHSTISRIKNKKSPFLLKLKNIHL